jgi:hypothetical protein
MPQLHISSVFGMLHLISARDAEGRKASTMTILTTASPNATAKLAVATAITAGLCATVLTAPPVHAAENRSSPEAALVSQEFGLYAADLERGLALIDEIPESVLVAGDAATQQWLRAHHPELLTASRADIVGCAGAIAWLIASTAIPAAKILKIKRLIDSLGGVSKAVQVFWGASFTWEKIHALGGAAAALGAELLGIATVKQKCFS